MEISKLDETKKIDKEYYLNNRDKLVGIALPYPVYFLENETNMTGIYTTIETVMIPKDVFT